MGAWTERISNHQAMSLAKEFQEVIGEVRAKLRLTKEDNQEGLIRLSGAADYTLAVLEGANPFLCRPEDFNGLASHLQLIIDALRRFLETKESPNVEEANRQMDGALEYLSKILPKHPKATYRDLPKVIQDVTSRVIEHKQYEATQRTKISDSTKALCDEVEALKETQEKALADLRSTLDESRGEFESEWAELLKRLEDLDASKRQEINSAFTQWSEEYQTEFDALQKAIEDRWGAREAELLEKQNAMLTKIGALETDTTNRFKSFEAEVARIVGATGNAAMAGEFKKIGEVEEARANRYQGHADKAWTALAVLSALVLLEGTIHYYAVGTPFPGGVAGIGPRLFVSISIAALGGYLMRQADRHRAAERWAKKLAAEISSMGAFLTPLDEEQQRAVRVAVALRIFGQPSDHEVSHENDGKGDHPMPSVDGLSKVLGQVLEFAKVAKTGKGS